MSKNVFDDTIEMVSLDDVSSNTMEISFDEMQEPNSKLGADLEMVMQETRVFSTKDIDEALLKNMEALAKADEIGETRIIDLPANEIEMNPEEASSEEFDDSDENIGDDEENEDIEEDDEAEEVDEDADESEDDDDLEFDDSDDGEILPRIRLFGSKKESAEETDEDSEESEEDSSEENEEDDSEENEEDETVETEESEDTAEDSEDEAEEEEEDSEEEDSEEESESEEEKTEEKNKKVGKTGKNSDKFAPSAVKNKKKKQPKKASKGAKPAKGKKSFAEFLKKCGPLEYAAVVIGLSVVGLIIALCIRFAGNKSNEDELEQFASVGLMFENMEEIGKDGIEVMSTKATVESLAKKEAEEKEKQELEKKEEEEEEEEEVAQATVNFSSVEKDIKIKFVDKKTGKMITGIKFEVKAKGPNGKEYSWIDSDMDGIIYADNLDAGDYEVTVMSIDPYEFPQTATKVKVQDTIVYQAINIMDEVVEMKDVDLSKEESISKDDVAVGTILSDTVAWVESTKTPVSGADGFKEISKNDIIKPGVTQTASANGFFKVTNVDPNNPDPGNPDGGDGSGNGSGNDGGDGSGNDGGNGGVTPPAPTPIRVSSVTITGADSVTAGEAITLSATVLPTDAENKTVTWTSDNTAVAIIDANGTLTAISPGTVNITATADGVSGTKTLTVAPVPVTVTLKVQDNAQNELGANSTITLIAGATHQLTVTASESAGGYVFETSTGAVAISETGLISTASEGAATVTVKSKNPDSNGQFATVSFNVLVIANSPLKTADGKDVYYKTAEGGYKQAMALDYDKYETFYAPTDTEYKYTGWNTIDGKVKYFDSNGNFVTGEQIIQGAKYNFASDGSLLLDSGSRGIDVSSYQGTIDWNKVKNAGISFVIIRCGFRGYGTGKLVKDDRFDSYINGANAAGLKVGIYVYSQAVNEMEAVEEASLAISMAKGHVISYPIFIDTEKTGANGRGDQISKEQRTEVCKAFCETIKSSGYTPGVYSNKSWLRNQLNVDQLSAYKIWLAHYCTETDYDKKYDLWQYSSKGQVDGIKGNVDLDVSYLGY